MRMNEIKVGTIAWTKISGRAVQVEVVAVVKDGYYTRYKVKNLDTGRTATVASCDKLHTIIDFCK